MTGLTIADPAFLGAAGGFSPLSLSPAVWLDASDTSTITQSAGKVSQWNDKSGNGRNVTQGTSASQPGTGGATKNGLNVLTFDGNDALVNTSITGLPTGAATIAVVVEFNAIAAFGDVVMFRASSTGTPFLAVQGVTTSGSFVRRRNDASSIYTSSFNSTRTWGLLTLFYDGSRVYFRRNKTAIADGANTGTASINALAIGAQFYNGGVFASLFNYMTGSVGEVVVTSSITTTERDALETYLMSKWGI